MHVSACQAEQHLVSGLQARKYCSVLLRSLAPLPVFFFLFHPATLFQPDPEPPTDSTDHPPHPQGINSIMYYLPSISQAVGFSTNSALGQTGMVGIVNFLSTFLAFVFMDRFGRRPLLMAGALLMGLSMATLGIVGTW